MNQETQIHIQHLKGLPPQLVEDFCSSLDSLAIPYELYEKELTPYAAVEDYITAAIAIYLAKPFLESFLKEAGKDSYFLFKSSISKLIKRASEIKMGVLVAGAKKIDYTNSNSKAISIHAEAFDGSNVKFLIPKDLSESESEDVINQALTILNDHLNKKEGDILITGSRLQSGKHTTLLEYDRNNKEFVMKIPDHLKKMANG
jgi:hypothetical protein